MVARQRSWGDLSVGMILVPTFTQLDLTGPYEVFARMPGTEVLLLASSLEPVRSEWGLAIVAGVFGVVILLAIYRLVAPRIT